MKKDKSNQINWWLIVGIVLAVAFAITISIAISLTTFTGNVIKVSSQTSGTEVYSKTEVDSKITSLQNQINSCCNQGSPAPENKTGSLTVTSSPTSATLYIDGVYKGATPKTISGLSVGDHRVEVSKSGYTTYSKTKYVAEGSNSLPVTLSKAVIKTFVTIKSYPVGSYVFINGDNKGQTPLTREMNPGTYTFLIKNFGYKDYTVKKTIPVGNTTISATLKKS